jgi:hypothetical protein
MVLSQELRCKAFCAEYPSYPEIDKQRNTGTRKLKMLILNVNIGFSKIILILREFSMQFSDM